MTDGNSNKLDSGAPPSYAAVVSQGPQQRMYLCFSGNSLPPGLPHFEFLAVPVGVPGHGSGPGPSRSYGPTPIQYQQQGYYPNQGNTLLDPRSQTAREGARHRAAMRFIEAFLWAVVIQALAAAIIGGTLYPDLGRYFLDTFRRGSTS